MRRLFDWALPLGCLLALVAACFGSVLVGGEQFAYRDAAHYYYPLYQQVQAEWDAGRVPLWSTQENGGMPLLGNPTAAVLYPGKLIYAALPLSLGRPALRRRPHAAGLRGDAGPDAVVGRRLDGSTLGALSYAFGVPILFQYCNIIFLVGAAWMPLGFRAVDRWLRLGRRSGLVELAVVLAMQVLGGDPQVAYLTGLCAGGYAVGLSWSRGRSGRALPGSWRWGLGVALVAGIVAWVAVTLVLAAWLPDLRPKEAPESTWSWMATSLKPIWDRMTGPEASTRRPRSRMPPRRSPAGVPGPRRPASRPLCPGCPWSPGWSWSAGGSSACSA